MGVYTLSICGWCKKEELPDYCIQRGFVRVALPKPLEVVPREGDIIIENNISTIDLRWDGSIFRYD